MKEEVTYVVVVVDVVDDVDDDKKSKEGCDKMLCQCEPAAAHVRCEQNKCRRY